MRRAAALVALAALLVAGACSGDDKAAKKPSSGDRGKVATPKKGGTLRLGSTRLTTLDPAQARSVEELLVVDQLFDSLTRLDAKTREPVPSVATRWTTTDQKVWDFFVDGGATFSNGRAITAKDVKYTLERIAKKGSGSPGADLLSLISGYKAVADGSTGDLAGVTNTDQVLHIVLDQPWSDLPAVLASPQFGIVDQGAAELPAEAKPFASEPTVSSGPFAFSRREGDTVVLNRAPASTAYVDRIEVREYPDVAAAYGDFRKGKLDWSRVPPDEVDSAGERYGREAFHPYVAELFYGFNLKNPKFADLRFREAIVRAIDRQAIASAVYVDTVKVLNGVVVEGVPGYQKDPCGDRCKHDVARSKQLLSEVFGTNPVPEVQINFDADPTQEKVAKAIEANLKEAGIPAQLAPKPPGEYGDFVVSGQQELFRLGWIAAYASPDAFVSPLFQSSSRDNVVGLSSPGLDALLAAARVEADRDKRIDLYQQAERAAMEQLPIIPIAQFRLFAVTSDRLEGVSLLSTGTFDAAKAWLSTRATSS